MVDTPLPHTHWKKSWQVFKNKGNLKDPAVLPLEGSAPRPVLEGKLPSSPLPLGKLREGEFAGYLIKDVGERLRRMPAFSVQSIIRKGPSFWRALRKGRSRLRGENSRVLSFAVFVATSWEAVRGLFTNIFLKDREGSQILNLCLNILWGAWHTVWINIWWMND